MKTIWFKAKTYGWGWTPVTWQGWVSIAIYVALLALEFQRIDALVVSGNDTLLNVGVPLVLITSLFIFLCYGTGERPHWSWGKKD